MNLSHSISRIDCFHLSYGALLGYSFILYVSNRWPIAIVIGIPIGIGGMAIAILMLRATGLEADQASQIDFVRSHNTGIWSVCFLAFAFSFTSLMLFPQPGHRFSLFFLIFTALYFASYLVFLRYFCGEDLGDSED